MNEKLLIGRLGRMWVLGLLGLAGALPLWAQDDASAKKNETITLEQPADSPASATKSDDEEESRASRHGNDVVMVGNDFLLKEDEFAKDVVVVSGNATINGRVTGDLVVVGGWAKVAGRVDGEMAVILGSATLEPNSEIERDVTVVGGALTREPGSKIGGAPHVVSRLGILPKFESLQTYLLHGPMLGRPIVPQLPWVWTVVGISFIIYLMIAVLFPRPIGVCVDTLEKRPVGSFFMGVLIFVLIAPLTFLLAVSFVGIVVIPFLFCAMIVAFLFGKVAVYRFAGTQLGKQLNLQTLQLPLVAFLIGAAIFCLLYMVPFLGFLVWSAIIPFGMGAALLAAFGGLRREGNGKSAAALGNPAPALPARPGQAESPLGGATASSYLSAPTGVSLNQPESSHGAEVATASPLPAAPPPVTSAGTSSADFISLPRAGFWLRTCATVLDALLFVFVVIVTGPKALLLWLVYHVAMWAWKGTTVGGIVLGVKLVRADGRPVDVGVALVRAAASIFSALALGLGFFWAGWNREKQSWHDKIAGTMMVIVPKGLPLL